LLPEDRGHGELCGPGPGTSIPADEKQLDPRDRLGWKILISVVSAGGCANLAGRAAPTIRSAAF